MTRALMALVHKEATPEQALSILRDLKDRGA